MTRQFIVTAPINFGLRKLEKICGDGDELMPVEVINLFDANPSLVLWDLEDFVEYCNNEELDLTSVWITVITVLVSDDYTPSRSTWYSRLVKF